MSVEGNVAYPLVVRGLGKHEIGKSGRRHAVDGRALQHAARRIDQISGGQRQRVALARALVFEPRLLLLDEPLSALDKQMRERTQHELRRIHDRLNMTTICVTHDQTEALTMSDKIAVMCAGRIVQFGSPREIYDQPAAKFIAEFMGETSFLPATARGTASSPQVARSEPRCRPRFRALPRNAGWRSGQKKSASSRALIRAELLRRHRTQPPAIAATVLQITVELEGGELVVARGPTSSSSEAQPGERVMIGVHAQDTVVVLE